MWVQGTTAHYTLQLGTPNLDTAWEDTYGLAMPPHLFALSDQGGGGLGRLCSSGRAKHAARSSRYWQGLGLLPRTPGLAGSTSWLLRRKWDGRHVWVVATYSPTVYVKLLPAAAVAGVTVLLAAMSAEACKLHRG
jgi:hypothetical protein